MNLMTWAANPNISFLPVTYTFSLLLSPESEL